MTSPHRWDSTGTRPSLSPACQLRKRYPGTRSVGSWLNPPRLQAANLLGELLRARGHTGERGDAEHVDLGADAPELPRDPSKVLVAPAGNLDRIESAQPVGQHDRIPWPDPSAPRTQDK